MLHVHLCNFQITPRVEQCIMYQCTNYHDTTKMNWIVCVWGKDILSYQQLGQSNSKSLKQAMRNTKLSLSLSKESIIFWFVIDWQIIKVKLRFFSLVSVSLTKIREILCTRREVRNLLTSWETKGQWKFNHPLHKKQIKSCSPKIPYPGYQSEVVIHHTLLGTQGTWPFVLLATAIQK